MYVTALASGLMWVWFLIVPPGSGGYANQLGEDIAQLRQPRSVRYRLEGSLQAGGQQLPVRGQGAFVQPDRFQLSLEAAGQRFEQVVIGQTTYLRSPNS